MDRYNKKIAKRVPLVFLLFLVALGAYVHEDGYELIGSFVLFAALIGFTILGGPKNFFGRTQ